MYLVENVKKVNEIFARHAVEFMFIGKGAAIIQGFSDSTQDIDVYPRNDAANNRRLAAAINELGFQLTAQTESEIVRGKDFVQLRDPFDLDIVFAPDGFDSYDEAKRLYGALHQGFPVLTIAGIVYNKRSAGRAKDRESLPRLVSYKEYLDGKK